MSASDFLKNKDWLNARYTTERLSCKKIGEQLDCDSAYVHKWLKYHDIPRRSLKETANEREFVMTPARQAHMEEWAKAKVGTHHTEAAKQLISQKLKTYYDTHPAELERLIQQAHSNARSGADNNFWKGGRVSQKQQAVIRAELISEKPCCWRCGYNAIVGVLVMHHKDRDRQNIARENLEILCPTCHMEDHYLQQDSVWSKVAR